MVGLRIAFADVRASPWLMIESGGVAFRGEPSTVRTPEVFSASKQEMLQRIFNRAELWEYRNNLLEYFGLPSEREALVEWLRSCLSGMGRTGV